MAPPNEGLFILALFVRNVSLVEDKREHAWGSAQRFVLNRGRSRGCRAAKLGLPCGAARLSAGATSPVLLTEVVFAAVSSVLLGAAALQARTLRGGALILLAAWRSALPARPRPR